MPAYTRAQLDSAGLVVNRNMWLGSGFLYCCPCRTYRFHYAMSHPGQRDCWEVCRYCDVYSGPQELKEEKNHEESKA